MNSAADWYAEQEYRERCGMPHEGAAMPKQKMTNADRIRQMTDEELADFLDTITDCCHGGETPSNCNRCPMKYSDKPPFCLIDSWLKQEAKDDAEAKG